MIAKDSYARTSIESITAFKRASSFSNIPRPSSSLKKQKENENVIQGSTFHQTQTISLSQQSQQHQQQQQQLQQQQQMQYTIAGVTSHSQKQQMVGSSIPLGYNQNVLNSSQKLRGKEAIVNQISNQAFQNGLTKLMTTTEPNSCQNTQRNNSQNSISSIQKSQLHQNPNSARMLSSSTTKQMTQPSSSSSVSNLSMANLSNTSQVQMSMSQQNIRHNTNNSSTALLPSNSNNTSSYNNNNKIVGNGQNGTQNIYPESTTKNLREILQSSNSSSSISKQNHLQSQKGNESSSTATTTKVQSNNSSKRVLTTPSTIGGGNSASDESLGYKDLHFYKKEILRMSLTKSPSIQLSQQQSSQLSSSQSQLSSSSIACGQANVNLNKENIDNVPTINNAHKQRHSDTVTTSNSLQQSQYTGSTSLQNTANKPVAAVKKSNKKNGNFYQKELQYYRQREIEYLQKIQKLEKENKRITNVVQKSDQDIKVLSNEIVAFSHRYNLLNSTQAQGQENNQDSNDCVIQQKQRVVTPAFVVDDQLIQSHTLLMMMNNSSNNINIDQHENTQPMHISELTNQDNDYSLSQIQYAQNQEKINMLQNYSTNLEQKLKQLEQNIHSNQNNQNTLGTSNAKLAQDKEVLNNCYKVLEQKYANLYAKTKDQKHQSDDTFNQIVFYSSEINKHSSLNSSNLTTLNHAFQNSVLKALDIGKQLSLLSNSE